MDGELIKKALCFHGKPMQKIWDDERGAGDLQAVGVPEDGNYSIYMDRQKYFTFQDRAKRLKLHQFLARKASDLYDVDLGKFTMKPAKLVQDAGDKNPPIVADLPPYESFLTKHQDKVKRLTLESIKPGDIVYATVVRDKFGTLMPLIVKPLCTDENNFKNLRDFKIKTIIPSQLTGGNKVETNDNVRCEVVDISIDADRMTLSLEPIADKNKNKKLGKVAPEELPPLCRKVSENSGTEKYEDHLIKAKELENPNYDILYAINGLDVNDNFTLMNSLKLGFPQQQYAKELRQIQASKWAFRSVAEGIEYFKMGQQFEAFHCLNKALNIDPRNVEGLVARGALYANKGSFLKAVEDFDKALKLNAHHVNARKYMGETLVALGRSYEEDNRIQDAAKAYRDCLNIIPTHEQAGILLEAIQQRTGASVDVVPPPMSVVGKMYDQQIDLDKASSPSHDSDSEDSSDSSSDSDASNSNEKKEGSLSPLSKKLALHAQELEAASRQQQFQQPFYMSLTQQQQPPQVFPNEFKLDDDDTESRVRKLLQDASKHKKDKKKTKKSKKAKKSKKGSKTAKDLVGKNIPVDIYQYGVNMQNTEHVLNANLKLVEKSIQVLKKRQELLDQATSTSYGARNREKSETPPPAPSFRPEKTRTSATTSFQTTIGFGKFSTQPSSSTRGLGPSSNEPKPPKFSFQIKNPVKVDKFGLVRLASPVLKKTPTPPSPNRVTRTKFSSRSRSKSRSRRRSRSRSRSGGRRRRWNSRSRSRSRSRSLSRDRYRGRRRRRSSSRDSRSNSYSYRRRRDSRSLSRSLSRGRRRRSSSSHGRYSSRSPRRTYRRSRSPRFGGPRRGRGSSRGGPSTKFGNRVWKNPNSNVSPPRKPSSSDGRWLHDKFDNQIDDPTIEEIDEIISKAQRERKQNIINNDKDILKKTNNKW